MEFSHVEVVGLLPDVHAMEAAVQELLTSGFDRGEVSIMASDNPALAAGDDRALTGDDPQLARRAWVEPESRVQGQGALAVALGYVGAVTAAALTLSSGGAVVPVIGGAVFGAGAGAGLGTALGRLFDRRFARRMERQIASGGILVWADCRDDQTEDRAAQVLRRHGASHVHALPLRAGQSPWARPN